MATNAQRGIAVTLSIPNNTKPSSSAYISYKAFRPVSILVLAPAALTGTVNPQISADDSTYYNISIDGGSDLAIAAGKALMIRNVPGIGYFRLNSGSNEGAQRDFVVYVLNDGLVP